jgi:hypothetical protein
MEKKCFKCKVVKPIYEYYKHSQMADGHLNKCKDCTRKDVKTRGDKLSENKEWLEKEKERGREKYYRLGYKDKNKPSYDEKKQIIARYYERYPEKKFARWKCSRLKPVVKGNHLHHWSYKEEHARDVIELPPSTHAMIHRFIVYDQERMMYRRSDNNSLLDSRDLHEAWISSITA